MTRCAIRAVAPAQRCVYANVEKPCHVHVVPCRVDDLGIQSGNTFWYAGSPV